MSTSTLPIIDLDVFRLDPASPAALAEATRAAEALIEYGALVVKDSRVSEAANDRFLDLMEDYFAQPETDLTNDLRPQFGYQAGVTLANTERPKCHSHTPCLAVIAALTPEERPVSTSDADAKCRFFHRMGIPPPATTRFASLAMENVTPVAFESTWNDDMEMWGQQIKCAVEGVVAMVSVGLGVGQDTLIEAGKYGPHLLAPTATDLVKYGTEGAAFAGFHTDLNCLTIHGRSRYAGLHIWSRNCGRRIAVSIPPGYLLVQAGKQIEHLTGGLILAGYHEVVCTRATREKMDVRKADTATAARPLIRISSTFFHHLSSDYLLDPTEFRKRIKPDLLDRYPSTSEAVYEPMLVGDLVQQELRSISLLDS